MTRFERDRPRLSTAWLSMSLYRAAAADELSDWLEEQEIDATGLDAGTSVELVEPWDALVVEAWHRIESAAPTEVDRWCAAYRAATPADHTVMVTVGDSARVEGRVTPDGVAVSYPASRLVSAQDPGHAVTEMVLTVVDEDVTQRGLDLPSLREVAGIP